MRLPAATDIAIEALFERFEQCYQRYAIAKNFEKPTSTHARLAEIGRLENRSFFKVGNQQ